LRQFARVRKQEPNALGGGEEDLGRTDVHRSASLTPHYAVRMAIGLDSEPPDQRARLPETAL
jgi:hypothetical protein